MVREHVNPYLLEAKLISEILLEVLIVYFAIFCISFLTIKKRKIKIPRKQVCGFSGRPMLE